MCEVEMWFQVDQKERLEKCKKKRERYENIKKIK